MKFTRLYVDDNKIIYFVDEKSTKKSNRLLTSDFLLVYSEVTNNKKIVHQFKSQNIPLFLFNKFGGYLFTRIDIHKQLPKQENMPKNKTAFVNLTDFFKPNNNGYIVIEGGLNCSPKFNTPVQFPINFKSTTIDKTLWLSNIRSVQRNITSPKEWFDDICKYCNFNIYPKEINNDSFKYNITFKDLIVLYDIHDKDEMKYIEKIERTFENMNQNITIYNTYDGLYKIILDKKLKVYKKNDEFLVMKFNDLISSDIKFTLDMFL